MKIIFNSTPQSKKVKQNIVLNLCYGYNNCMLMKYQYDYETVMEVSKMNYILKIQTFVMMFIFACMAGKGQTAKADETVNSQSVYEKLDKGEDVNILILGDSIGISSHASDTEHSWVYQMEQSL